jgi:UDP-N-acetylglucosamine--N-acetylmuramyl-(pentapeptide) pyrophosphoryl-undecaprenol N-acetylglucosamine transferase
VAELAVAGIGAVLVPLPGAIADEQTQNARFLVAAGGAVLIPQVELTPQRLAGFLRDASRASMLELAIAARKVGRPDAAERVAAVCIALAQRS